MTDRLTHRLIEVMYETKRDLSGFLIGPYYCED